MNRIMMMAVAVLMMIPLLLAGCSGTNSKTDENDVGAPVKAPIKADPVTLKVYIATNLSDEDYQSEFVAFVKEAYPNITLQMERVKSADVPNRISAGEFPDLMLTPISDINAWKDLDILSDLNPLVKSNKMDLNRFDPSALNLLKAVGNNQKLFALRC
jgi:multiple sugar transport system substrate-binding protein